MTTAPRSGPAAQRRGGPTNPSPGDLGPFMAVPGALLCATDKRGRFLSVGPAWEQTLGYRTSELEGRFVIDLVHQEDLDETRRAWRGLLKEGTIQGLAHRLRHKDGSYRTLAWNASLNADGIVYVLAQETDRPPALSSSELERRVAERTAALREANRELEAFCYSVSHDLRTPLRSIDGFSRAVIEDYGDVIGPVGRDHLERVRAASQRTGRLMDGLLRLTRLSKARLRREDVDLSALALEIGEELARPEPRRKASLTVQQGLRLQADRSLIRLLMTLLLENAWKFTGETPAPLIEVGEDDGGIFVRDNGAGFDMAYSSKLFKPFERLHQTTEFPGDGLGLATAARIVALHGGRIWADGAVGQGATVRFRI